MNTPITTKNHAIDAAGKRRGKVATEAASVLLGKHAVDFARHTIEDVTVSIANVSKMDVSEKKGKEIYQTYSGYPGGQTRETLDHLAKRRGYAEVVRRTIGGMLPNNKHKKLLLKQLVITE